MGNFLSDSIKIPYLPCYHEGFSPYFQSNLTSLYHILSFNQELQSFVPSVTFLPQSPCCPTIKGLQYAGNTLPRQSETTACCFSSLPLLGLFPWPMLLPKLNLTLTYRGVWQIKYEHHYMLLMLLLPYRFKFSY